MFRLGMWRKTLHVELPLAARTVRAFVPLAQQQAQYRHGLLLPMCAARPDDGQRDSGNQEN
jgi:hypothetical protein